MFFSGNDRKVVNSELKAIGLQLTHQSDPDLPTTKFTTYLIEPGSKDSSSGTKAGHDMRGVLLIIFLSCPFR